MKLLLVLESVQDQIEEVASDNSLSHDDVVLACKQAGGKYWKYVLRQWYEGIIRLPEDAYRVKETLANFDKVKSRLQNKDINSYKRLSDIENVVEPLLGIKTNNKICDINLPGVRIVKRDGPYVIVRVDDPESLAELGEGTKWCTRASYPNCMAEQYIDDYGHMYIILLNERPIVQYTPIYDEIKDINNDWINNTNATKLLSLIPPPPIDSDAKTLFTYAAFVMMQRWPEAEPRIMKDPASARWYADHFIGRWPEAEPYIMRDTDEACVYAAEIIGGRWPEAEPYIMKNRSAAAWYKKHIYPKTGA